MSVPYIPIYSSSSTKISRGQKSRERENEIQEDSSKGSSMSIEIGAGHRSEASNEEQEQNESFIAEGEETTSIHKLMELVFSGKKSLRLGIEGPLPSLITADLRQSQPDLAAEPFETLQRPSREHVEYDPQENHDPNTLDKEREMLEQGDGHSKDPLIHGIIYPDIELVLQQPFLLDYYKTWPDEENENWATSSSRIREEVKGTLSFLHLKKGLSKFSYEMYGFTALKLSGKSLTDIGLFARLPMTFNALSHVDLSRNKLADISALSGLTTITHLDVSHNKLKKLLFMYPEWYWNVDEPGKLDIEGNVSRSITQLSSSGWALCGTGISQLRWVNYSHNLVRNLEGPRHWAHYPYLSYLNLSHNHISDLRSEERVPISAGRTANPEGDEGCPEGRVTQCELSTLSVLHTLNISNNFISRVEGLNGLCVHNLIMSNNSISSWEGETGQLYEDAIYANICDQIDANFGANESTLDSHGTASNGIREGEICSSVDVSTERVEESSHGKDDVLIYHEAREGSSTADSLPLPTVRVMRKRRVEGVEAREERGEGDASKHHAADEYPSPKTVEVLFTETDRKREKIPIEVLYKPKKSLSSVENNSEDVSVMDASYLEDDGEGDYATRRRRLEVLHFSECFRLSEEDRSNTGSDSVRSSFVPSGSTCRRKSCDSTPGLTFAPGGGREKEASPDSVSISSMFDYEWEGYEPDDPCFAKGRKAKKALEKRLAAERPPRSAVPRVEVLYERESTREEEGESVEEDDADWDGEVAERLYGEWDDPELRVLYTSRLELDSDYDSRSIERSSGGTGTEGDVVRVLYIAEASDGTGLARTEPEGPNEEDLDDGVEVVFRLADGNRDALVEPELPSRKSVEVLFRRIGDERESLFGFSLAEDEEEISEEVGENGSVDWVEVCFEVYERVDPEGSEVGGEAIGDAETPGPSSSDGVVEVEGEADGVVEVEGEADDVPKKIEVGLLKRVNANRFKEYVGIRSLKWLTELHLECNRLTTLKILRGTYWLRSLFLQDNLIEDIGEIMYLSELHRLSNLDMTGNPVCSVKDFRKTTLFIVPSLVYLNQVRSSDMETARSREFIFHKDPFFRAARVVQDLLSASELRRENHVPWLCPELDALPYLHSPYPVLLLVGPEGSGNKELCQSLLERLPQKVHLSNLLTTRPTTSKRYVSAPHSSEKEETDSRKYTGDPTSSFPIYRPVTKEKFLELLTAGSFASVSEDGGFLFGFDKCEAVRAARGGRVLVAAVDLTTALVLHLSEFCGKPRLVLVLPESASAHEKNLRRESRSGGFAAGGNHRLTSSDPSEGVTQIGGGSESGCETSDGFILVGDLSAEQEFVQRNLEAREECLTAHRNNPGVFHCGVFCDERDSALEKVVAMVDEMHSERKERCMRKNESCKSSWFEESSSKYIDDKINARLEKELLGCVPMWE